MDNFKCKILFRFRTDEVKEYKITRFIVEDSQGGRHILNLFGSQATGLAVGDEIKITGHYFKKFNFELLNVRKDGSIQKITGSAPDMVSHESHEMHEETDITPESQTKSFKTGEFINELLATVVAERTRDVTLKTGEKKTIQELFLKSNGSRIKFTNWGETKFGSGDQVVIKGAYVKEYKGEQSLTLTRRGSIKRKS